MRAAKLAAAALIFSVSVLGQGTIRFTNRIPGLFDAPVTRCDGTGAAAGVTSQLFLVTGSGASSTYSALEPATTFRTDSPAAAFYVTEPGSYVRVPGVPAGQLVTVVMRTWEGPNYDTASVRGQSADIYVTLGPLVGGGGVGEPAFPGLLENIRAFSLCIPEPAISIIFLCGLAGLLPLRRKPAS